MGMRFWSVPHDCSFETRDARTCARNDRGNDHNVKRHYTALSNDMTNRFWLSDLRRAEQPAPLPVNNTYHRTKRLFPVRPEPLARGLPEQAISTSLADESIRVSLFCTMLEESTMCEAGEFRKLVF